jgi:hypothetical protein
MKAYDSNEGMVPLIPDLGNRTSVNVKIHALAALPWGGGGRGGSVGPIPCLEALENRKFSRLLTAIEI